MTDVSIRSGTELAREIQQTHRSTARNLSNWSFGVQIPCDICTRFRRYLCSTKCSCKIIERINKRSQQTRIHFSFYANARLYICTALQSLLFYLIINIQRHSVSVQSTCLLDTVYKLKLHREVGSALLT